MPAWAASGRRTRARRRSRTVTSSARERPVGDAIVVAARTGLAAAAEYVQLDELADGDEIAAGLTCRRSASSLAVIRPSSSASTAAHTRAGMRRRDAA